MSNWLPVRKEVQITLSVPEAFELFTNGMARWWPMRTHSCFQDQAERIEIEPHVGGRVTEHARDGKASPWGRILIWEPPHRFAMTWHPANAPEQATRLEVSFEAIEGGSVLRLVHEGWEVRGDKAGDVRDEYDTGWGKVLQNFLQVARADSQAQPTAMAGSRLDMVVLTPMLRRAFHEGRERLSALLQAQVPPDWPEFPEFFDDAALPDKGEQWPTFLFIDRSIRSLVGNGGFTSAPDDHGRVEIGYEVAPAFRRQGYATEAAMALLRFARSRSGVQGVQAHTLAGHDGSTAVLQKIGMKFVVELPNEEVGKVWQWRLDFSHPELP